MAFWAEVFKVLIFSGCRPCTSEAAPHPAQSTREDSWAPSRQTWIWTTSEPEADQYMVKATWGDLIHFDLIHCHICIHTHIYTFVHIHARFRVNRYIQIYIYIWCSVDQPPPLRPPPMVEV